MIVIIAPLLAGLVTGVVGQGITAQTNRIRFPGFPAGDIGRAAQIFRSLRARGLEPAATTGPFGNLVVGSADQNLDLLAQEAAFRRLNQEVLTELLTEDPLLFIRGLPVGDPRRVAAGLDSQNTSGQFAPAPSFPRQVTLPIRPPTTAQRRAMQRTFRAARSSFSVRSIGGRAVR